MKREIYLLRHAEAQMEQFGKSDKDRALTMHGFHQIEEMVPRFSEILKNLEIVYCSNAKRTRQTLEGMRHAIPSAAEVVFDDRLYNCTKRNLNTVFESIPDHFSNVLIVAHNPGLSEVLQTTLSKISPVPPYHDLPTLGLAHVKLELETWGGFEPIQANFAALYKPDVKPIKYVSGLEY